MSIDLNWETLTAGPDGIALAETIRDFIHDRFQTVTLPRFIRTVNVHTFDFGQTAPEIALKDICDPLSDFYEVTEDDIDDDDEVNGDGTEFSGDDDYEARNLRERRRADRLARNNTPAQGTHPPPYIDTRHAGLRSIQTPGEMGSPFLRVSTPGIPGGTSNLNYFHSQFASGISGTQTPLAAVAGAHLPNGWPDYSSLPAGQRLAHHHSRSGSSISRPSTGDSTHQQAIRERASVSTLATSGVTTRPHTREGLPDEEAVIDDREQSSSPPRRFREPKVEDLQTVFRVRYSGDVRLSLTAEILLDYPMPSFVGIPVKLNITGLSFDGAAVLAYIRKKAHFCFLSPEDAYVALGPEELDNNGSGLKMGGLLQEIKVESEIGQRENGKQVLKNVGKVEKFVLEQVRRIFEDEFVYPSFWTFLI